MCLTGKFWICNYSTYTKQVSRAMFLKLLFLVALLQFGDSQSQDQCVREIRELKQDIQATVTNMVNAESVTREDVQELVEDKATKEDAETIKRKITTSNQLIRDVLASNQSATREDVQGLVQDITALSETVAAVLNDALASNKNVTRKAVQELFEDKATKEDVTGALNQTVAAANQHIVDILTSNQTVTRKVVEGLVENKATKEDVSQSASEVVQALNHSVTTRNREVVEMLECTKSLVEATQAAIGQEQCVTREEVQNVVRAEVESVIRSEVQAIQTEVQSVKTEVRSLTSQISEIHAHLMPPTYTCNGTPGWRQVVFINMTDTSYNCPPGLNLTSYSKRTCGRAHSNRRDCSSTTFSVGGSEYSRVCGRVRGYQVGATSAFYGYLVNSRSFGRQYVDGVSLTHGAAGRRQHIWTFAAGASEVDNGRFSNEKCPCDTSDKAVVSPPFVGNDYFCESGLNSPWTSCDSLCGVPFLDDPLWDGQNCTSTSACCQFNNPPWFTKNLPNPTTDDIELRICLQYTANKDDVPLELIELYIQ